MFCIILYNNCISWLGGMSISYHYLAIKLVSHIDTSSNKSEFYDALVYGMEIAISTICNMLLVLGIGICFDILLETLVFAIFFMPYRVMTGGVHAKSHIMCILLYVLCEVGTIFVTYECMDARSLSVILFFGILVSECICFCYKGKKLESDGSRRKFKRASRIIITFDGIVLILMLIKGDLFMKYCCIGTMALVIQSSSLLPIWKWKG